MHAQESAALFAVGELDDGIDQGIAVANFFDRIDGGVREILVSKNRIGVLVCVVFEIGRGGRLGCFSAGNTACTSGAEQKDKRKTDKKSKRFHNRDLVFSVRLTQAFFT